MTTGAFNVDLVSGFIDRKTVRAAVRAMTDESSSPKEISLRSSSVQPRNNSLAIGAIRPHGRRITIRIALQSAETALKFIRAMRDTWAPVLFFAALLGFVGLGISHVDAKVRAEELKALADQHAECSTRFAIDQVASGECAWAGAAQPDRIDYGALHTLFTNLHW